MTHEVTDADKATLKQHKGFVDLKYQPFKCFTDDADAGYSLSGGWVDCGDHVKFGQTMFYAGYMLAFAYSEFPEGFDDYYSWNYEGYKSSGDFTWEGKKGKPNGIPDILDEVKYETDFFIKCARNATTFYSQVGMGDPDHLNWVSSVAMAALPKTQGGQANGARDIRKNPNDCVMPAMCAATLAVMSRLYKKFDPDYAALCLKHAEYAYAYAKSKKGLTEAATGGSFYPAKSNWEDSYAIMLVEMYRATETLSYKTEALTYGKLLHNHNWTLCYNNCDDIAAYLLATYGDTDAKTLLETLVAGYKKDANTDSVFMRGPSWGALRYTASQAFSAALLSKLNGETKINRYTLKTVEFIMGKNSKNLSFIVGFGANHAKRPHHRNYYSSDDIAAKQNDLPVPLKNAQFGYLVGGAKDPAAFNDKTEDYQSTEGGIDYNAGIVGALGYLVSKIAPVDVNKFGHPTPELGETKTLCGLGSVTLTAAIDLSNLEVGEQITYNWYKGTTTTPFAQGADKKSVVVTQADEYICEVAEIGNKWKTSDRVLVTAALPDIDLGSAINLCESVYATLDAKIVGSGINYIWKK
ncbi:MAG: glycoside hydrolase family 9 protein [Bacteroidales bacterium]|nr:glycoside hydrolase family 9 protein [Bacteroidales bacterium]